MKYHYGWTRDHLDWRDSKLTPDPDLVVKVPLPPSCDLRRTTLLPPIYDQGELGTCVCNATAAAVDFQRNKQGEAFEFPSRLWLYYHTRELEDTPPDDDAGCEIRDAIKVLARHGVPPEKDWPYDESKFSVEPPDTLDAEALGFRALLYSRVSQEEYFLKECLAILGRPISFGISCFSALQSDQVAKTGDLPMPDPDEAPEGGHAILLVGYDDSTRKFIWRNSWGTDWGSKGYGTIPYEYVLNPGLASDFWTITLET